MEVSFEPIPPFQSQGCSNQYSKLVTRVCWMECRPSGKRRCSSLDEPRLGHASWRLWKIAEREKVLVIMPKGSCTFPWHAQRINRMTLRCKNRVTRSQLRCRDSEL